MNHDLTFAEFRAANEARRKQGVLHEQPLARGLEAGVFRLAALLKQGRKESGEEIAEQLADVFACLDMLAASLEVNLAAAIAKRFNDQSEWLGLPERLPVHSTSAAVDAAGTGS